MGASLSRTLSRRTRYAQIAASESFGEMDTLDAPVCGRQIGGGNVEGGEEVVEEIVCQEAGLDNLASLGRSVVRDAPCTERVISRVRAGGVTNLTVYVEPPSPFVQPQFPLLESGGSDTSLEQGHTSEKLKGDLDVTKNSIDSGNALILIPDTNYKRHM